MIKNCVRAKREKLGLSQTRLACLVGTAQGVLSEVEAGKRLPWARLRKSLSKILNASETELFPDDEAPQEGG